MNPLTEKQLDDLLYRAKGDPQVPSRHLLQSLLTRYRQQFAPSPHGQRAAFRTRSALAVVFAVLSLVLGVFVGRSSWVTSAYKHNGSATGISFREKESCSGQGDGSVLPQGGLGFVELIPAKEITPYIVRGQNNDKQ